MISSIGNNFVQLLTSRAVDKGVGEEKYGIHFCQSLRAAPGRRSASKAHSTRIGRWKASVDSVTRQRKNRYCRPSGCACSTTAFVIPSCGGTSGLVDVMFVEGEGGEGWYGDVAGRANFSIRAHVR
jgi:hypothetical protein